MKKIKKNLSKVVLVVTFLAGLSLLLYPTVANWWNSFHATRSIASYDETIAALPPEQYDELFDAAIAYNETLLDDGGRYFPSDAEHQYYMDLLSIEGSEVLGSIQIPTQKINLPIYHGTSEEVLQVGAGHLEGTSLPIGGESTHTVISGHRGLPSAELFNNIVNLAEGDVFVIKVLNQTITYQVERIRTVLPTEVNDIDIEPGRDLATLVTCTPYGVNTHRILITGHRIENLSEDFLNTKDNAGLVSQTLIAAILAGIILVVLFVLLMIRSSKQKREQKKKQKLAAADAAKLDERPDPASANTPNQESKLSPSKDGGLDQAGSSDNHTDSMTQSKKTKKPNKGSVPNLRSFLLSAKQKKAGKTEQADQTHKAESSASDSVKAEKQTSASIKENQASSKQSKKSETDLLASGNAVQAASERTKKSQSEKKQDQSIESLYKQLKDLKPEDPMETEAKALYEQFEQEKRSGKDK